MSLLFFVIISLGLIATICNAACTFRDTGTSGLTLDLRALEHATLKGNDNEYDYIFTPCRNGDECPTESGTDTGMSIQQKEPDECYILSNWDNGDTRPSYDSVDGTWKFEYTNGNECLGEPRHFYVYINCEMGAGDYTVSSAGEISNCVYEMYIDSKWACPGEVYSPSDSSLSGGTVFLIILASVMFAYFAIGWIVCAFINQKDRGFGDVVGNIPHLGFWSKLPALVLAGCCFSKDFFVGLFSGKGASDGVTAGNEYDAIDE